VLSSRWTRRRLVPVALVLASTAVAAAADWPQFRGPQRNGISDETGLLTTLPRGGPPVLWQKAVGAGLSGPVVAGERLILHHRVGDEEVVVCLNAATGAELWKFAYPTVYQDDLGVPGDVGPRSTPAIAGKYVFTLGAEGRLHCLELETGKKVWGRALNDEYHVRKGYFGVATSPLVVDGNVLVNVGGPGAGIVAFDQTSGKELWRATDHEASYSSPVVATIAGVRHVLFLTREGLVSLNPDNGTVRFSKHWRARINASVNAAAPLVVGDLVFVSASYNTGALLVRVGANGFDEIWSGEEIMSNHYNTCVYRDGHLYGVDGRQEAGARLRCVELKTGKVRWTREQFGCASLLGADGQLIALTENGELVLIEPTPAAYREKSRVAVLSAPCRAEPALAGGRLYGRDARRLVCWNLKR
jgi:outer membrane protein assembly factor BamB